MFPLIDSFLKHDLRPTEQIDSACTYESLATWNKSAYLSVSRSFKMTSKGLVNHGDSLKRRSTHSLMSSGSAATDASEQRHRTLSVASQESNGVLSGNSSCCPPSYFRVVLLGAVGVGKSALIRQFMTSEYKGTFDIATRKYNLWMLTFFSLVCLQCVVLL